MSGMDPMGGGAPKEPEINGFTDKVQRTNSYTAYPTGTPYFAPNSENISVHNAFSFVLHS
jgi:hypothetical protein